MTQPILLNTIKQGVWIDNSLPLLKEKISQQFQLSPAHSAIKVTNHLAQRMALIYGLSLKQKRQQTSIDQIQLKNTTYFATLFHSNDFYPLLTGLLKLQYQAMEIDWENAVLVSKILNYEMKQGSKVLLELGVFSS